MAESRYACLSCGTWTCSACEGKRANTDIRYCSYPCGGCRRREGVLSPAMHTAKMWRTHNDGELPRPYGDRPSADHWGPCFGPRTVPPVLYRGVPLPDEPIDFDAFCRGVDAAMKAETETRWRLT